ncbi:MAG: uL13 family ribosomal protein [Candidatus Taylorbacteria bacterium]|nr:uL13 family ribosomal protein [Candidatus Taylorbacteria bacterium]
MNHTTIDAQGKKLGRVASEVASLLIGKRTVSFSRNKVADVKVSIVNTSRASFDIKKLKQKEYITFTGFRGGLFSETLEHLIARKGTKEVFERAVYRMLPSNSLRKSMMKNLTITE